MATVGRAILPVQKHDLLGVGDPSSDAFGLKLQARQGDRVEASRVMQIIGLDEAAGGLDHVESGLISRHQAALVEAAFQQES